MNPFRHWTLLDWLLLPLAAALACGVWGVACWGVMWLLSQLY